MVKTVVSEFHWTLTEIRNLYLDDIDFFGLEYWYNHIKDLYKPENK